MSTTMSQPIEIGISDEEVNLKHLLWQLREQQSALSAVTELRQEVLSLKLSYNAAKAEFQPVKEDIETIRETIKKEREISRDELLAHSKELENQLQELRTQQEGTQATCAEMISNETNLLKDISDLDGQCRQIHQRLDGSLEALKQEVTAAQKAAERAKDLANELKQSMQETMVSCQERLAYVETDLQQSKEQLSTLREMMEQESAERGHMEGQMLKEQQTIHRDLSELKKDQGIRDECIKELHQKLDQVNAQVLEDSKALVSVGGRLGLCEKQGVSLTELQKNFQQLQSEQVLHAERLEHFQQCFHHEMQLHRSQEHSALSEELKDLQRHRERHEDLLQKALGFSSSLKSSEEHWQKMLHENCEKLRATQAAAELRLLEAAKTAGNLMKQTSRLEERTNSLHEQMQRLQTEEQVQRADFNTFDSKIKEFGMSNASMNLELQRQKQSFSIVTKQLEQLSSESKKMAGEIEVRMEDQLKSVSQQATALNKACEEIGKLQERTEEQKNSVAQLRAEQSDLSKQQGSFEAWSKTADTKVMQLSAEFAEVHSQVVHCQALEPELNRLEKALEDEAQRNETALNQAKEAEDMMSSSLRDLKAFVGEVKGELKEEIASHSQQLEGELTEAKINQAKSQEKQEQTEQMAERLGERLASVEQLSARLQALQEADSKHQTDVHENLKEDLKSLHRKQEEAEVTQQRTSRDITQLSDKLREGHEVKLVENKRTDEKIQVLQASIDEARTQHHQARVQDQQAQMQEHQAVEERFQVLDGQICTLQEELREQMRSVSFEQAQLTTNSVRSAEKGFQTALDSCKRGLDRLDERIQSNDLRLAQQSEKLAKMETKETLATEDDKISSFQTSISLCEHQNALQAADQAQLRKRLDDLHGKTTTLLERCQEEVMESKVALKSLQVELSGVKAQQKQLKDEEETLQQAQGLEVQQVQASAEGAHKRLDTLDGRVELFESFKQRLEQRLEELQAAQWTWSADKAALESQGSSSRQRIEGLEKTLQAYLSKDLLESVRSEMDHLRSRLTAAEQQQASSGLELRKLLDAELAGAQAALRERLSEALASLPPLEERLREDAQQLEVKLSHAMSRTDDVQKELDDLVTSWVKEQKCREGDVALLREGLRALDSTSSSLQVQLEAIRGAHGQLEAQHLSLMDQSKTQGQELFDHFMEAFVSSAQDSVCALPLRCSQCCASCALWVHPA